MLRGFKFLCAAIIVIQASAYNTSVLAEPLSATPPSGYIVFSSLVGRCMPGKDTSGSYELFLLRAPGHSEPIPLTDKATNERRKLGAAVWYPIFSPNGREVLFAANLFPGTVDLDLLESPIYRRQGLNLFRMAIDSKSLKAVTTDGNGYDYFTWSPNGKWIAAVQMGWPPYDQVYAWDLIKGKRHLLTKRSKEESITDVFWSADGKNIMFQLWPSTGHQGPNLYAVPHSGGKPRILIIGKGNRYGYSFSPDGKHVAFIQDGIAYIANANGGNSLPAVKPVRVAANAVWLRPQWSSDNRRLAVAEVTSDKAGSFYETKLHTYDLSTRQDGVIATIQNNVIGVKWSKNGQWLVVKVLRAGQTGNPDPKTGWYAFHREGLLAVSTKDGRVVTLKEPNEETKGLDWFETVK